MLVEEPTQLVDPAPAVTPPRRSSGFRRALLRVIRLLGMVLALGATASLAVGVAVVGPNVEEWRGVLPTLDGFGYPDSDDIQSADALGWAKQQDQGGRPSGGESGKTEPSHRFLAPSKAAAPWPGHWCSSDKIGYRIDVTGARLAGMDPEREIRRWNDAFAQWAKASKGNYEFEYRGKANLPLVMNSSLEDMKISDHRLKRGEIAITYATSRSMGDPRWSDYLHAGLGPSLGIGGIGPVQWGSGQPRNGLIANGTVILDAHDVSELNGSLPTVYVHEAGHAMGLGHVIDPDQMMFEDAPASAQISGGDRLGIQKLASAGCP